MTSYNEDKQIKSDWDNLPEGEVPEQFDFFDIEYEITPEEVEEELTNRND